MIIKLVVIIHTPYNDELPRVDPDRYQHPPYRDANPGHPRTPSITQHVSAWACLIRSDYNFVFLFFAYFYLTSKKDKTSILIVTMPLLCRSLPSSSCSSSWMCSSSSLCPAHGWPTRRTTLSGTICVVCTGLPSSSPSLFFCSKYLLF